MAKQQRWTAKRKSEVILQILRPTTTIIDEWGYVLVYRQGGQRLFRVISDSYERRNVILTINLEFLNVYRNLKFPRKSV